MSALIEDFFLRVSTFSWIFTIVSKKYTLRFLFILLCIKNYIRRNVKKWVTMCNARDSTFSCIFNIFRFLFILLCIKNYIRRNVKKWVTMCHPSLKILFHEFLLLVAFLIFSRKNIFFDIYSYYCALKTI
jgi:hypothetical protein